MSRYGCNNAHESRGDNNYYRTYREKRNRITNFWGAPYMVVDSYGFLQIPTLTSPFPTISKTWLPREFSTMAENDESLALVSSGVSNSSEAVASTSTASETHRNVRNSLNFSHPLFHRVIVKYFKM